MPKIKEPNTLTMSPFAVAQVRAEAAAAKFEQARLDARTADARSSSALADFDDCAADAEAVRITREAFDLRSREARAAHVAVDAAEREHAAALVDVQRAELDEIAPRLDAAAARAAIASAASELVQLEATHEAKMQAIRARSTAISADHSAAIARAVELANAVGVSAPTAKPLPPAQFAASVVAARFDAAGATGDLRQHVLGLRRMLLGTDELDQDAQKLYPLAEERRDLLAGTRQARIAAIKVDLETKRRAAIERSRVEAEQKFDDVVAYVVAAAWKKSDLNHARSAVVAEVERLGLLRDEDLVEMRRRCYRAAEQAWRARQAPGDSAAKEVVDLSADDDDLESGGVAA